MSLVFKHLIRSVILKPGQSLVLLLTVFLSAVIFACSYEVIAAIYDERNIATAAEFGSADIVITANAATGDRFTSAAGLDGADGIAVAGGYYSIPAYDSEGAVFGAATDFASVSELFTFCFTDYGRLTQANVNTSVFISSQYACSRGLALGDRVTLSFLGTEKSFTVCGINRYPMFGAYDVLVNAEGACALLARISPVFAVFGGDNLPYSTLVVKVKDGADAASVAETIRNLPAYSDRNVELCSVSEQRLGFENMLQNILLTAIIVLAAVVAVVLVFFSLDIISAQRTEATRAFLMAGVPPRKLFAAEATETFIYLFLGCAAGLVVSSVLLGAVGRLGFVYAVVSLSLRSVVICCAAEAAVGAVALVLRRTTLRSVRRGKARTVAVLVAAAVAVAGAAIAAVVLPVGYGWYASVVALFGFLALVLCGMLPLLRAVSRAVSAAAGRSDKPARATALIAAKNIGRVEGLLNVSRLLTVLFSVLIVFAVCLSYCDRQVNEATGYFNCDFVVFGATDAAAEEIKGSDGICDSCMAFFDDNAEFYDGRNIFAVSAEDGSFITYSPAVGPSGNEIVLSEAVASLYGLKAGDAVTLTVGGEERQFVLSESESEADYVAYIDAGYCGLSGNMLLVRAEEGADKAEAERRLAQMLAVYGLLVEDAESVLAAQSSFMITFMRAVSAFICGIFAASAIGAVNLTGVSYAKRRAERQSLRIVGVTRRKIADITAFEGIYMAVISLLTAAAGGTYLCAMLNCGMLSFGFALF